jgi:hypothetical protein
LEPLDPLDPLDPATKEEGGTMKGREGRGRGEEAATSALEPARLFLQTCTGMDVGAAGVEAMSVGLRQGIVNIAQLTIDDIDRFTECLTGTLGVKHLVHSTVYTAPSSIMVMAGSTRCIVNRIVSTPRVHSTVYTAPSSYCRPSCLRLPHMLMVYAHFIRPL